MTSRHRQGGWWQWAIPAAVGALNLLSGKNSAEAAERGQREANATNLEIAQRQMDFQREMSGTAYQRGVADMQAAGLNPMLAYSQGGASAPQGATTQVQNPKAQSAQIMQNAIGSSAQQAMAIYGAYQQAEATQANTELMAAQTAKTQSETMAHDLNSAKLIADTDYVNTQRAKQYEEILGSRFDSQEKMMRYRANMGHEELKGTTFAADAARRKAESRTAESESLIRKYGVAEAKSTSDFFNKAETLPKWVQLILQTMRAANIGFKH